MSRDRPDPAATTPAAVILTINAGSSSLKFALFDAEAGDHPRCSGLIERIGSDDARCRIRDARGQAAAGTAMPAGAGATHETAMRWLLALLPGLAGGPITAAGHRIVHGGAEFTAPARLDAAAVEALDRLTPLARTHQPHALAAIRAMRAVWPDLAQVGCFDTAFHATIAPVGRAIALPRAVTGRGVRRYGFHGLSYQWIARSLPGLLGERAAGRVIAAHLGNGASLCGMVGGLSRATTMGFTPLDGLVMGERPGLTDPGAVLFMMEEMGLDAASIRRMLFRESGLLGVSGLSNDMRVLLASDAPAARFAVDLYVHRAVREIGAIAAEIGGVDALVFTAGVGENAAPIRARIVAGCRWLGAALDPAANDRAGPVISPPGAAVAVAVLPTNEEAVIARDIRALLGLADEE